MRFDWMVNLLNWDYTLEDGTYMPSVRGRGNGFGQGHDARDLVNQIAGLNRGYGFDLSISSEGGAEWYEGQVWSSLWPEGAREDWYLRLLEFRAQIEGTGVAYNQGFSAVDDPCRGLDDPRALERCEGGTRRLAARSADDSHGRLQASCGSSRIQRFCGDHDLRPVEWRTEEPHPRGGSPELRGVGARGHPEALNPERCVDLIE